MSVHGRIFSVMVLDVTIWGAAEKRGHKERIGVQSQVLDTPLVSEGPGT